MDNESFLNSSPTELEEFFVKQLCATPIVLHTNELTIEHCRAVEYDARYDQNRSCYDRSRPCFIPGTEVAISIPFHGDKGLWNYAPSSFSLGGYPDIEISPANILLKYYYADDSCNPKQLRQKIDQQTKRLGDAIFVMHNDVVRHNATIPDVIRNAIAAKRKLALEAINAIAALGIPLKKKEKPDTYIAPVQRRTLPLVQPKPTKGSYTPEYQLEEKEYQHILRVIRSLTHVIERNPESFASLNEESIRDHILLQLNGHYEGNATGETFNRGGKTDILIRINDKNIFIGECKFWHGSKKFEETIDQLLNYLTWRDCKCALIIFNRQKRSSSVIQKMHETIAAHRGHLKTMAHDPTGDSRYVFVKESDPGKEIIITTQLFDVPS